MIIFTDLHIIVGSGAFIIIQLLATPGLDLEYVGKTANWIFLLVPHYSLSTGLRDMYTTYVTSKMCKHFVNACVANTPGFTQDHCWKIACLVMGKSTEMFKNSCCSKYYFIHFDSITKEGFSPNYLIRKKIYQQGVADAFSVVVMFFT